MERYLCVPLRRGVRVVEGARLESVYTPKVYRGFESLSLRNLKKACSFCYRLFSFDSYLLIRQLADGFNAVAARSSP